jgi:hypothetical protein
MLHFRGEVCKMNETEYFDCLRCHAVTPIAVRPPKCAKCGSGTGVVSKSAEGARPVRTIDGGLGRAQRPAGSEQSSWPYGLQ